MITATFHIPNDTTESSLGRYEDQVFESNRDAVAHVVAQNESGVETYLAHIRPATLVDAVWATSRKIDNGRTPTDVFTKLIEEVGELAQELLVINGKSFKPAGKDGVVGEAVDAINCLVDLILLVQPDITEAEIAQIARTKQLKWENHHFTSKELAARQRWEADDLERHLQAQERINSATLGDGLLATVCDCATCKFQNDESECSVCEICSIKSSQYVKKDDK
jgi:NTP pyrophosphatase (non-canonical NTP hydrolase)